MKVRGGVRSTWPRFCEARVPEADGGSWCGGSELVTEALDHLLEPLDLLQEEFDSRLQPTWDVDGAGAETGGGLTGALIGFRIRLRRSQRPRYRIPRLVIAWTFLALAVICLTWLMFRVTGPRQ